MPKQIKASVSPQVYFGYEMPPSSELPKGLQLGFTLTDEKAHLEGFAEILEQAIADVRSAAKNK